MLYYDTDSCLYIYKNGLLYRVETGDYLGQMTEELMEYEAGSYIVEFVSGGPQTYAYRWSTKQQKCTLVCKIKGLTLNMKTSQTLNFEKLKTILSEPAQSMEIEEFRIHWTRDKNIVIVPETSLKSRKLKENIIVHMRNYHLATVKCLYLI